MLEIKQEPEHFIVNEIAHLNLVPEGDYGIFTLIKKDYTTEEAINIIAKHLKLQPKAIGFAGNKDKRAITFQFISIPNGSKEHELTLPGIQLAFIGFSNEPIRLGSLLGNQFIIRVYSDQLPKEQKYMPNYFNDQRFSANNPEVGKAIIKKDFKQAVELISENDHEFKQSAAQHLKVHKNDYVGCLKLLSKQRLLLYVHSFQSLLFNQALDMYIRRNTTNFREHEIYGMKFAFPNEQLEQIKLPVPGFATAFTPTTKELYAPLLRAHDVQLIEFVIKEIPWLSQDGTTREGFVEIEKLKITRIKYIEYLLEFFLKKGSYATIAVKSLF